MTRGRTILISVLAGFIGSGIVIAVVVIISFRGIASRHELTPEEKGLLVQIDDFVAFGVVPRHGTYFEEFTAKRNLDGSLELEYVYQSDAGENAIVIKSEAEVCRDVKAAKESFSGRVSAYRMGVKLGSPKTLVLVPDPSLLSVGEERFAGMLRRNGAAAGNMVVARQHKTVYSLIIGSVFLGSKDDLDALLEPKLAKAGTVSLP